MSAFVMEALPQVREAPAAEPEPEPIRNHQAEDPQTRNTQAEDLLAKRNAALKAASSASLTAWKTASVAGVAVAKAASLTSVAAVKTVSSNGAAMFGKVSAAAIDVAKRAASGGRCPECGSLDILKTDASGAIRDAYRCRKCDCEFTGIGPEGARRLVKVGLKAASVLSWLAWTVIDNA